MEPRVPTTLRALSRALQVVLDHYVDVDAGFGPGEREVLEAAQRALIRASAILGQGGRP